MRLLSVFLVFILIVFLGGCAKSKLETERASTLERAKMMWQDTKISTVHIFGSKAGTITGYLLVPDKAAKGSHPAVLELHGYTDRKEAWLETNGYSKGGSVTRKLIDHGYIVLAIDLPYHGARLPDARVPEQGKLVLDNWSQFFNAALSDIGKSIDYLVKIKGVARDKIGLVGYSLGGMISYSIANTDSRIRALATCVAPPDRGKPYPGAPHENIANLENTPVLVIAATQDHNYVIEDAQWFYEILPSKNKDFVIYESTHSLPAEYSTQVERWFLHYLGE
jgi:dienelactone hydrolase